MPAGGTGWRPDPLASPPGDERRGSVVAVSGVDVDVDAVQEAARAVGAAGEGLRGRSVPQVSLCGSDDVVDACVRAYQMVRQQETNLAAGWAELARRTTAGLDQLVRVDAELAAGAP